MDTNVKNILGSISDFLQSEDFTTIIEIAEEITKESKIPFLPRIIKVLKVMNKAQPLVQSTSNVIGNLSAKTDFQEKFKRLFEIALDDGIITNEEKEILRPCAQKAGYTDEEFEMMVLAKKILN